jgi:hypothetical protein
VSGDTSVRQTELGLKPFSAMLGALQVQDEMRVKFRIVAHEPHPRRRARWRPAPARLRAPGAATAASLSSASSSSALYALRRALNMICGSTATARLVRS